MPLNDQEKARLLDEIKKEMDRRKSETNLVWLKTLSSCVQYVLTDGRNDWGQRKFHYEYVPQTNDVEVLFHCEPGVNPAERAKFDSLIANDELLASMSHDKEGMPHCAIKYVKIPYEYGNLEKTAKNAVEKMIEFEKKYGDKILGYVKESKSPSKFETIPSVVKENKMAENPYVDLLLNNHNIILHGAPGTGKTYLAKEIAKNLMFNAEERALINKSESEVGDEEKDEFEALKKRFNEQCGFVQFHQSYDYTDFVEGLRPVNGNENQIGFERKDGIFKKFCEKAIQNQIVNGVDNFEDCYNKLLESVAEKGIVEIPALRGSPFAISLQDNGNGFVLLLKNDADVYEKKQYGYYNFEQCYNIYRGMSGVPSKNQDNYRKAIVEYMKDKFGLKAYVAGETSSELKPFVFIIDEINRGEMSKIFGELFYSIDPGYRIKFSNLKEKIFPTTIRTQYANLQKSQNKFDEVLEIKDADNYGHFFVPENVYIIGTMNDIDRSVESMDFAMRRRFAFKEITAEQSQTMFGDGTKWKDGKDNIVDVSNCLENIKERMTNLNNAILNKKFNLGTSYQIGGAYFLKFACYCKKDENGKVSGGQEGAFKQLWDNHLECVLREYLRGMDEADDLREDLRKAYNLEVQYEDKGDVKKISNEKPGTTNSPSV